MKLLSCITYFISVVCGFSAAHEPQIGNIATSCCYKKPLVSIITSVYKGDLYIENFLKTITQIPDFKNYELILINANSPGNEEKFIAPYLAHYPNIVYEKLDHDPGLYAVWNYAIKHKASADYVTNCNLDDSPNPEIFKKHREALEKNPDIALVYSDYLITNEPNQTFANNTYKWVVEAPEFDVSRMYNCLPGPQPMWKKSLHHCAGYFREDFKVSGDLEMWNRAVSKGLKFKRVPGIATLFYDSPAGLSSPKNQEKNELRTRENIFTYNTYGALWNKVPAHPRLLIKIPTRSRPEQFFNQLDNYYRNLSGQISYHFLISCDTDDVSMNNPHVIEQLSSYPYLSFSFSDNKSKIEAYNRDLDAHCFDLVLAVGDDMEPVMWGYDKVVVDAMQKHFPDYDGVLNFHDGHVGSACNTLPVIGHKFYKKYGYLFNPEYTSLCANEELTLVSRILGKEHIDNRVIIRHNHPVWGLGAWDELYQRNESYKDKDSALFKQRRERHFDIRDDQFKKVWSILICTLDERQGQFKTLHNNLTSQIQSAGLSDAIEILAFRDNREHSVGHKRNWLVSKSSGKYISFIDDDDRVHDQYIQLIYDALQQDPDCVSLVGIMTTNGDNPQKFVHSIRYNSIYDQKDGVFVRPPNHLNPMRKAIAAQFLFPETNYGEDADWALRIARSNLIKKEIEISEPYYFYRYDGKYQSANNKNISIENDQYYVTACDAHYFDSLLTCIGSIHSHSAHNCKGIAVANLGMNGDQIKKLNTIENAIVFDIEKVHPDILKPFHVGSGKFVPGWYAWKPVAIKQALEKFPHVIWLDASCIVFKPLDDLFAYIRDTGYFLATIGNEIDNGKFRHPLSWCTVKRVMDAFELTREDRRGILSSEQVMAGFLGISRTGTSAFLDDWYSYAHDLTYFADDGSTPDGFGTGRHDLALLSAISYTKGLKIFRQDYTQDQAINIGRHDTLTPIYITWHGAYVNNNTHVYTARADSARFKYYQDKIRYKQIKERVEA